MQKKLFFVAIIPSEKICREVKAFKLYAKEHFDSGHALTSPAHITLQPPFRFSMTDFQLLDNKLKDFVTKASSFDLGLNNFSAFPPRVIFVNIAECPELLVLQQKLSIYLKDTLSIVNDRPYHKFHPHLTIAFKDLKRDRFEAAWEYFSIITYQRFFQVNSIFLLKHENRQWHIFKEYLFN